MRLIRHVDVGRPLLFAIALGLAACAVGPDFVKPKLSPAAGYDEGTLATTTDATPHRAGAAQTFIEGRDIPREWWTLFGSDALTQLVKEAIAASPTLDAAKASLLQAQETALATRGGMFPSLSAKASRTDVGFSAASIGQSYTEVFSLNTTQLSLSYPLDIFGGTRRSIESAEAQAAYQKFQLEAAYVSLSSNIVVAAIQEASLRAQIAATETVIATKRRVLDLLQTQFNLGGINQADVLAQQAGLAQTEATLPSLNNSLARQRNLLHLLAGRFPSEKLTERFDLNQLRLPTELPLSLPSKLVEQRPDIQSATAQLHAATAQVGVATANMLPQISLSASYGAISLGRIFKPGSMIWDYGASLTQPIFQGGQLLHQREAAKAAVQVAAAQYRSTVLGAFQNVSDVLHALQSDAQALAAQQAAERAAEASLRIAETQYRTGATSFLTLLNAQNSYQQAQIALIQAEATRYIDTAALFQALGGGWWNREEPTTAEKK